MNPTNDERARFEEFAVSKGWNPIRSHAGGYMELITANAWEGWLARSQSAPAAQGEKPTAFAVMQGEVLLSTHRTEPDAADDAATYPDQCDVQVRPLYRSPQPPAPGVVSDAPFQQRVQPWMMACFGPEISADRVERNHRFIEEALELVQANGMPRADAHALVDYVYGRPPGVLSQEVGGVMVTLAALCLANGTDMHADGETELARINAPEMIEKIRAKQAAKPRGSALPVAAPPADARDADTKRLDYIASEYLEITPFPMPTPGGDDADVGWRIYDFYQAPPEKRLVAEVFRDNLREAIDAARSADRAMGGES